MSAGVDVSAAFDFERSEIRSRVLVNFIQAYYTVDMDAFGKQVSFSSLYGVAAQRRAWWCWCGSAAVCVLYHLRSPSCLYGRVNGDDE